MLLELDSLLLEHKLTTKKLQNCKIALNKQTKKPNKTLHPALENLDMHTFYWGLKNPQYYEV